MTGEEKLQGDVTIKVRTQPGHGCSSPDLNIFAQGAQKLPIIYNWIFFFFFFVQLIAILGSSLGLSLQELSWRKETIQKLKLYTSQLRNGLVWNSYKLYFPQTLLMAVKVIQQLQQNWSVPEHTPYVFLVTLIHWGMSVQVENSFLK